MMISRIQIVVASSYLLLWF